MTNLNPDSQNRTNKKNVGIGLLSHFRKNFLASIVVFLVALPLCIGIAVAAGVSPARAILIGTIGGLVVGFFAGSPLRGSGSTGSLLVIVGELLSKCRESFSG